MAWPIPREPPVTIATRSLSGSKDGDTSMLVSAARMVKLEEMCWGIENGWIATVFISYHITSERMAIGIAERKINRPAG